MFFISFARAWAQNIKPESAVARVRTDPRSANWYRVEGTVSNMPEFAKVFKCSPKAKPCLDASPADTEIDWETYMYQLELYLKGERDYALISGPTGPIVYPAGHVYVHQLLYTLTDSGTNLRKAPEVYAVLYLASLALTAAIYKQAGGVPNWVLLLLPEQEVALDICGAAIFAFGRGWDALGVVLLSSTLSVKMCVLLYVLVILFQCRGLLSTAVHMLAFVGIQLLVGLPFLLHYPWSYLKNSYEFSRVFLCKWTANWRFLGEELFLSRGWANTLLVAHVFVLANFGLLMWCRQLRDTACFGLAKRDREPESPARPRTHPARTGFLLDVDRTPLKVAKESAQSSTAVLDEGTGTSTWSRERKLLHLLKLERLQGTLWASWPYANALTSLPNGHPDLTHIGCFDCDIGPPTTPRFNPTLSATAFYSGRTGNARFAPGSLERVRLGAALLAATPTAAAARRMREDPRHELGVRDATQRQKKIYNLEPQVEVHANARKAAALRDG
ncbi:hypothetical protein ONZ51_g10758 [Trametes cubensis]|uniref:Dol-P-Man:Man(5)GlcNAc(2)-PP-Dol alpha-1,3-mannosyltransferase n=1 Tax=Trametes cubensis TaxID=1111947 RepID=A0AAD7TIT9_9APHY|nr:hypothetical protein ONZ51_g10758 [Trametes cubensis]